MSETIPTNRPQTIVEPAAPSQQEALEARGLTQEQWDAHVVAVEEAWGKFAWVRTSSDEFSQRKREEADVEEARSERRV
jgi:hypothetical protein